MDWVERAVELLRCVYCLILALTRRSTVALHQSLSQVGLFARLPIPSDEGNRAT